MRRWPFVLAAAVFVIAAAGAAGLPFAEERLASAIKSRAAQRPGTKVDSVQVSLLQRRIVLGELTIAQGADSTMRMGRLDMRGLSWPLADLLAGRTPFTGWQWGDPVQAEHVEIDDFELVHAIEGEWRAAKVILDGVDLQRHEQPATVPPGGLTRQALAFANLSVRRFEERDFSFQPADEFGLALRIKGIVVDGLDKGLLKSVTVTDSEVRDTASRPAPQLSIGDLTMRSLDLRLPLSRLRDVEWVPGMPIGRIWFEQVTIDRIGGDVLADLAVTPGRISFVSTRDGARATGRTRVEGFAIRPQGLNRDTAQVLAVLTLFGLREVTASLDCTGGEDRDKGEFALERCALEAPGLAELEFSFRLVDTDETFWSVLDGGDVLQMAASSAALGAAKLVLRDRGLLERLVKLNATSRGVSPAEARAAMARDVRRYQPTDMLITEDVTRLADVIARFVERGGTLTVEARPDPPLTFDGARIFLGSGPGPDVVSVLGLSATAGK